MVGQAERIEHEPDLGSGRMHDERRVMLLGVRLGDEEHVDARGVDEVDVGEVGDDEPGQTSDGITQRRQQCRCGRGSTSPSTATTTRAPCISLVQRNARGAGNGRPSHWSGARRLPPIGAGDGCWFEPTADISNSTPTVEAERIFS